MNENLFSQTYDQIKAGALGQGQQNFQMLGVPKTFNWGVATTGTFDPQAYEVISYVAKWSPVGTFGYGDATVYDAYRRIFEHITWNVSPAQERAYTDATNQETSKSNDLTQAITNENQAYLSQKQNGGVIFASQYPDIASWIAGPGKSYKDAVTKAQEAFEQAQDFKLQLAKAFMPTSLQDKIAALQKPSGDPASSNAPQGWMKVADGAGILRWQPEWKVETSGRDWRAELSQGSMGAFTVQLNAADSTNDLDKSWAGGSAGYDAFFWGVSGSGGWEKMNLTESDKNVTATISVKSSTTVKVGPGDWYDGGFLSDLGKGQTGPSGQGFTIVPPWVAKAAQNSLFGQFGLLPARINELVVVYKPSFEINMSSSTFDKYHEKFDAGGGIRIGPFHFGGHGGHESTYVHSTSGGTTFKGESTSEDPLIIGATVVFPGVDEA